MRDKDVFDLGEKVIQDILNDGTFYQKNITIYDFLDKFLDIVRDLNLLTDDSMDYTKLVIKQEYPDETYKEGTITVFKINERAYFESTSVIRPDKSIQRKALTLGTSSDIITNNIVDDYGNYFSNKVEFKIFSNSAQHLHTVARLLESICFKYKKNLKLYVHDILYEGQSKLEYSDKYFKKRLFSKSIYLEVITCETYSVVSEELKFIKIT